MSMDNAETGSSAPIRESRSLHNLFSGFFFNHVDPSKSTPGPHVSPFREGAEHEGVSNDSNAVALLFGAQFEVDDIKLLESTANFKSTAKSSSIRRSETWTSSLVKSDPFLPDPSSLPPSPSNSVPSVQSPSGIINFTASGGSDSGTGSGLKALRKSLDEIFKPDQALKDSRDPTRNTGTSSSFPNHDHEPSKPRHPRHSLPSLLGDQGDHSLPGTNDFSSPTSPKSKPSIRRQFTLPALVESEFTTPEVQSQVVEKWRNQGDVDVNHNIVVPEPGPAAPSTIQSYGSEVKTPTGDLTQPEAMKVPEVRPRRFGILELFTSGERKNVRNKEVNIMAPQSW